MSGDRITLSIPREEGFEHVAQLVLSGVAARLNVTFESLDDLQVALESLLRRAESDGDLTVDLRLEDEAISARVGPFNGTLRAELERETGDDVGLRRVLETVVDEVTLDGAWVELTKKIERRS
ncbi:MAG: hypothetical protein WBB74_01280 [Gaiellaceae bacterium]